MIDRFTSYRTGPALRAGEPGAVIRRARGGTEMVNLIWGFAPKAASGRPFTTVRSEGRSFGGRHCLVPASEFFLSSGPKQAGRKWRFTLVADDFFYLAGLWRPATQAWPAAYALVTHPANPDVAPFHDRQMAVIRRSDRLSWLDSERPEGEVLTPLPAGSFRVEQVDGPPPGPPLFAW
jgi:putative SOS response-associated peptidase YedK